MIFGKLTNNREPTTFEKYYMASKCCWAAGYAAQPTFWSLGTFKEARFFGVLKKSIVMPSIAFTAIQFFTQLLQLIKTTISLCDDNKIKATCPPT